MIDRAREGGLLVIKRGVHRNAVRFLAPLVLSEQDSARRLPSSTTRWLRNRPRSRRKPKTVPGFAETYDVV
jgi:hypothetical protein